MQSKLIDIAPLWLWRSTLHDSLGSLLRRFSMSNTNDDSTAHSRRRAIVLLFQLTVWLAIFGIVAFSVSIKSGLITAAIMAGFYVMTTAFGSRSETLSLAAGTKLDERTLSIRARAGLTSFGLLYIALVIGLAIELARGAHDSLLWEGLVVGAFTIWIASLALIRRRS
jgi:hypothetical protein